MGKYKESRGLSSDACPDSLDYKTVYVYHYYFLCVKWLEFYFLKVNKYDAAYPAFLKPISVCKYQLNWHNESVVFIMRIYLWYIIHIFKGRIILQKET